MQVFSINNYSFPLLFLFLVISTTSGISQAVRDFNEISLAGSSDFAYPQSLCIDSKDTHIWVADFSNNRVLRFDISDLTGVMADEATKAADQYSLEQNYPNPFNSSTVIYFRTGVTAEAELNVIDPTGRIVSVLFRGTAEKGRQYKCSFNAERLSSGIYYYMLRTPEGLRVKKMCHCK